MANEARAWEPRVTPELVRLATALRRRACHDIGLVAASEEVEISEVAFQVAAAVAHVGGEPVGLLDLRSSFGGRSGPVGRSSGRVVFSAEWVTPVLAVVTTSAGLSPGLHGPAGLRVAMSKTFPSLRHRVFDLSWFTHTGEHLEALRAVDGSMIVARAGRTKASQIDRWMSAIPATRNLGVLLLDAPDAELMR